MESVEIYKKNIDDSNVNQKAIVFKVLFNNDVSQGLVPYNNLPYDNEMSESKQLLLKFFKKIQLSIRTEKQKSNLRTIYLHNPRDVLPHYNMTEEIYNANKDILDTMNIVIFIREPRYDINDPEYDSYNANEDMRLQHLLDYVQYKREHPNNN